MALTMLDGGVADEDVEASEAVEGGSGEIDGGSALRRHRRARMASLSG